MNRILPPRPFLDAIFGRVLVLWLFLHGVSAVGSSPAPAASPQSPVGSPITILWIMAVIILVLRVEMGRRSELLFLANLGHSFRRIALVICVECLVLEVGLRLAVA